MFEFLLEVQRTVRELLSGYINDYVQTRDLFALAALLPFGIVFGVAHAMTPGHSKAVLASYVLGSGIAVRKALNASLILSCVHIASAVLLATIANSLLTRTIVGAGQAPALEWTSRVALALIGLWMVLRPLLRKPHVHGETQGFAFLAGLIPCPLTLFIMTLAIAKGVPAAGLAFAVAMLMGVVIVLSGVALLSASVRNGLNSVLEAHHSLFDLTTRGVEVVCGIALAGLAVYALVQT